MGKMQRFKREIRSANGKQFAFDLRSGFGAALGGLFERIARGKVHDAEVREIFGVSDDEKDPVFVRLQAGPQFVPGQTTGKYTVLVSLHGVALYDLEFQPYCFSTLLLSQIMENLANDASVEAIVLDINTPGGHVTGTQEAADAVWKARQKKPVIGIVNPLCASAGYWIGSQCTKLIGVPSADIGSIGVFMCHYDCSAMLADAGIKPTFIFAGEYKTEGNSMEPLGAEALAWFQSEVDQTYSDFLAAVARGRGITAEKVSERFGKGRCFSAPMAKRAGMIDEIAPIKLALKSCGLTMEMPEETGRRRGEALENEQAATPPAPDDVAALDQAAGGDDSAAAPTFISRDGCGPCSFTQVSAPGVTTIYVAQPWPAKILIVPEMLEQGGSNRCIFVAGDTITMAVANGAAVYTKIGEAEGGVWVCKLEPDSSYRPAPASDPAAFDPKAPLEVSDEFRAEAEAGARRKSAEAHRRRLAILSA
jgi:signal peptide peptidase SppA